MSRVIKYYALLERRDIDLAFKSTTENGETRMVICLGSYEFPVTMDKLHDLRGMLGDILEGHEPKPIVTRWQHFKAVFG